MKLLSIILVIFSAVVAHGYVMKRIDALQDLVETINFDSEGNLFAVTVSNTNARKLLKLNDRKEISWIIDIPSDVQYVNDMLVTSQGDLYFRFVRNSFTILSILTANSTKIEEIDQLSDSLFILDDMNNLFYEKENNTFILRPNSTVPIPIKNLKDFHPTGKDTVPAVSDKEGNIYIPSINNIIALITKEALQEEIPYAQIYDIVDDSNQVKISNLLVDERNDVWIVLILRSSVLLKKLSNGTVETVWADESFLYAYGTSAMDRIFVLGSRPGSISIHYVTLDNVVSEVPKLTNLTETISLGYPQVGDDGNVYYSGYETFSAELGPLIKIPHGELTPVPIAFDRGSIFLFNVDFNGALWVPVKNKGVYYVPKDEVTPVKIPGVPDSCARTFYTITVNWKFKEVYASCNNDWYVAIDEK